MKRILSNTATVIAFTVLTLFLIGVVVDFDESYGDFALIISIIFWATFLYKKFKKRKHETEVELMSTNPIPTVTSTLVDATSTLPLGAKNHLSQKRSTGVAFMWIVNIIITILLSTGLFLSTMMAWIEIDSYPLHDPDIFSAQHLIFILYVLVIIVTTIFAIYKSSTTKSPILSVQDSHYLVFWPVILVGIMFYVA